MAYGHEGLFLAWIPCYGAAHESSYSRSKTEEADAICDLTILMADGKSQRTVGNVRTARCFFNVSWHAHSNPIHQSLSHGQTPSQWRTLLPLSSNHMAVSLDYNVSYRVVMVVMGLIVKQ